MSWTTPKTDWAAGNAIPSTELNKIGDNLDYLKERATDGVLLEFYTTTDFLTADMDPAQSAITLLRRTTPVDANFPTMVEWHLKKATGTKTAGTDRVRLTHGITTVYPNTLTRIYGVPLIVSNVTSLGIAEITTDGYIEFWPDNGDGGKLTWAAGVLNGIDNMILTYNKWPS